MPLYLTKSDVAELIDPASAVPVLEACFRRMAAGSVELMPRRRFAIEGGTFAVMAAADRELGVAGLKSYTIVDGKLAFVVCLFSLDDGSLQALIEADRLGQVRTGAASGVAARFLARDGATTLGLIGSGWRHGRSSRRSGRRCPRWNVRSCGHAPPRSVPRLRPPPAPSRPRRRRRRARATSSSR